LESNSFNQILKKRSGVTGIATDGNNHKAP